MYTIENQTFYLNSDIGSLLKEMQSYLHEKHLVITDNKGIPIDDKEIVNIVSTNQTYRFYTTSVSVLENEFIIEMIDYVERLEKHFPKIAASNDKVLIVNSFIEIINSVVELEGVSKYFNMNVVNIERINEIVNRALVRIEQDDLEYIIDVIEYEMSPIFSELKSRLLERQSH